MGGNSSRTERRKQRTRAKRGIAKKLFGASAIGPGQKKDEKELIKWGKEAVPELSEQELRNIIDEMVTESDGALCHAGNSNYYFNSAGEATEYIDSLESPITP